MTAANKSILTSEFLSDHRRMTRLLRDVVDRIENGQIDAGRSLAEELDRVAGPHIAFEESVLYPAVGSRVGVGLERKLLGEHEEARSGLAQLLSAEADQLRDVEYRRKIVAALRTGLKHAESCGTLVSHLEELTDDQQESAVAQLNELRQTGHHWTTLRR